MSSKLAIEHNRALLLLAVFCENIGHVSLILKAAQLLIIAIVSFFIIIEFQRQRMVILLTTDSDEISDEVDEF